MTFKKYLSGLILWAALSATVGAQDQVTANDRVQINETFTNGFRHPGIGLTKDILDTARKQVLAKRDPWYTAFNKMAAHDLSSKTVNCRNQSKEDPTKPDSDAFDNKGMMRRLRTDGDIAYRQALMYYFTGDSAYRANAMHIIRIWSQLDPKKYNSFSASHIHAPYVVKDLVMAAELMRYTDSPNSKLSWQDKDTTNLKNNLIDPSVETFMYSNGWFMNQSGYPCAGAMACFIFLNDREGYNTRVEWFTVNKTAPNKGWSSSIQDLFRKVEVNALTGERVREPVIQLMEMGRDQAHSAGDLEIAKTTVRLLQAQGTQVDPVRGTASTSSNAVAPVEFLDHRILKAADHMCRFMLGYDTPWIPSPSSIGENGDIEQIYARIADNYRGRIRNLQFWDLYYYYTYKKGVNVAKVAPYYYEAFKKRVVSSDREWFFIPPETTGEGARTPQTEQEPEVIQIVERSTPLIDASIVQEAGTSFLRAKTSPKGARFALLSIKTPSKTIGLKIRTTGVAALKMEGFAKIWLLPNTQGEWRYVTYTMPEIEHVEDIIFVQVMGSSRTVVDFEQFLRKPENQLKPLTFTEDSQTRNIQAYIGAPITLDFSAQSDGTIVYSSSDKPAGSKLNPDTGVFTWSPQETGKYNLVIEAFDGKQITPVWVWIKVAKDRRAAMEAIKSKHDPDLTYIQGTVDNCIKLYAEVGRTINNDNDAVYWKKLAKLKAAFNALEVLTPLLPDGSINFPQMAKSTEIGDSIGLLTDSNDDTYPLSHLAVDMGYVFDFGAEFQMSFIAFAIEGRMNFDERTEGTVFYGSNDQQNWTELTKSTERSTESVKIDVSKSKQAKRFRYLRIKKHGRGLFEPSEMRIYGTRHETE